MKSRKVDEAVNVTLGPHAAEIRYAISALRTPVTPSSINTTSSQCSRYTHLNNNFITTHQLYNQSCNHALRHTQAHHSPKPGTR